MKIKLKSKKTESMPYEREEVWVGKQKIGEIGVAQSTGTCTGAYWFKYCYRLEGSERFDWLAGFTFENVEADGGKTKTTAKERAINALLKEVGV